MVGINVGVAAPMAFFPFAGWKNSFFGDLHAHGKGRGGVLHRAEGDYEPVVLGWGRFLTCGGLSIRLPRPWTIRAPKWRVTNPPQATKPAPQGSRAATRRGADPLGPTPQNRRGLRRFESVVVDE